MTRVLGIDPGLASCGLGLVDIVGTKRRLIASDTVHTSPSTPLEERLDEIGRRALRLIEGADLVGLEEQGDAWYGNEERGGTNAAARKVQEVLGLLRGLALALGKPRQVIRSQTIRAILGVTKGGKGAVAAMVRHLVEGVPAAGKISQHAIDAIAHAIVAEKKQHASLLLQMQFPGTERPRRRVRKFRTAKAARLAGALP